MTDTNPRELIQRLADALTNAVRIIHNEDGTHHISTATSVLDEARAYLAQPETEGLTDEGLEDIGERTFQHTCSAEAERIIDQRCRARFLYPHSRRPLVTHPLTDEIIEHPLTDEIIDTFASPQYDYFQDIGEINLGFDHDNLRVAADWQLEQVIHWLRDNLQEHRYSGINILVDYVIQDLREAMRPITQEDN